VATARVTGPEAPFGVTASFGVATWDESEETIEPALNRADQALYQAKAGGRNRVVLGAAAVPV
jgi:diguanylate cyclase (GGDEF)-like protein